MNSSDSFLMVVKDAKIDRRNIKVLEKAIYKLFLEGYTHVCLDMKNVKFIDNTFLEFLFRMQKEISLNMYNINQDIMSTLFLTKFDRFVKIYNNEIDTAEELKPIVKRRFAILSLFLIVINLLP